MKINEIKQLIKTVIVETLNEEYHHIKSEYGLYEGENHITAIFEDNSRLKFEVHYRNNHGEDKLKWRKRARTTWNSLANKLHNDVPLSEVGNPIQKSWKQCFEEALKDPKMKEYIRSHPEHQIFNKNVAPVMDPVNFTPK